MMFSKLLNKSEINKILVVSLSNIGDVILTFPVIDVLKRDFPMAQLSVVIGPKAESLVKGNPHFEKVYIFDKRQSSFKSASWVLELKNERFDLVADLRNTAIPFMTFPKYRTSSRIEKLDGQHMREKHLNHLKSAYDFGQPSGQRFSIAITEEISSGIEQMITNDIGRNSLFVVVAPGAADSAKRWSEEKFAAVCDRLIEEHDIKVVFVGDGKDIQVSRAIQGRMKHKAVDLSGRTNLIQLAALLKLCLFALVNDSAPMHLASYLDVPVLALFGPTDPIQYGPWSARSCFLRKNEACRACAQTKMALSHICMTGIKVDDVFGVLQIDALEGCVNFHP